MIDTTGLRSEVPLMWFLGRLVALSILPVLLLALWLAYDSVHTDRVQQDREAAQLARNIAFSIDQHLEIRIRALNMLAISSFLDDPARWSDLYKLAQGFRESFDSHVILADVGEPMRMLFNTRVPLGDPLPLLPSPKGHAAATAAVATLKPAVGDSFIGPVANEPLVAVAVPALREGTPVFVLVTTFATHQLQQQLDELALPDGWAISLRDGRGAVIARRAPQEFDAVQEVDPSGRFEALSSVSSWSVTVEIPRGLQQAQTLTTGIALGLGLLGVTLAGALGGSAARRRVCRAVAAITRESSVEQVPTISEIATVRRRLDGIATELRESEARFRRLFENAPVPMALASEQGDILVRNTRYEQLFGYTAAETPSIAEWWVMAYPDPVRRARVQQSWDAAVAQAAQTHESIDAGEYRITCKDGQERSVRISCVLLPDGMLSSFIDVTEQRRAEAQLLLWSNAFEKAELNLAMGDAVKQRLIAVNPAFAKRRGYRPPEMVDMPIARLVAPDRWEAFRAKLREADAKGHLVFEAEHVCRDGARFPVLLDVTVTRSDADEPARRIVYALDISGLKAAEAARRESEERLRSVFDQQFQFMAILTPKGRVIDVNELVLRFQGYAREDFIGRLFWESPAWRDHSEWQHIWPERLARAAEMEGPLLTQDIYQMRDGQVRMADAATTAIRGPDGSLRWYVIQATDTTERRLAEAARRESEERLRLFIEHAPAALAMFDREMRYLAVSRRWLEDYGLPHDNILGRCHYLVFPEIGEDLKAVHRRALAGEVIAGDDERFERADGSLQWLRWEVRPWHAVDGGIGGIVIFSEDITTRKQAEQELERHRAHLEERVAERTAELTQARAEAERLAHAKGEFLANMSHEIRTPMNAVLGLAYLLEQQPLPEEARSLARKIHQSGRSLLGIINDILDFSKIESGRIEIEQTPFRLNDVLDNLATIMTTSAAGKGIDLAIRPPEGLDAALVGDPLRLGQILINLTGNAIKFTPAGIVEVRVDLVARTESRITLRFSVCDTGIGIDPEIQARLFQPFTQADASTTRRFGGTGLGLFICRRLAELMGGRIGLESAMGEGSTFWLELSFDLAEPVPDARIPIAPMRVLVAAHNPVVREAAVATVDALGWSAIPAESDGEVLRRILHEEALRGADAAVLLEWQIPECDGLTTANAIRDALPADSLPFLFLFTAHPIEEARKLPGIEAVDAVLAKPLSPSALYDAVLAARRRRPGEPAREEPTAVRVRRLSGIRLLVVDDSDINREVAQSIFADEGAEVHLLNDGREAVDWLTANPNAVDIVLMDVHMPLMDGRTATALIRGTPDIARIPVVALTADAMGNQERAALDAGMDAFLSKPFDVSEAIALILRLTGHLTGTPEDPLILTDREGSGSAHATPVGAAATDPVAGGPGSDASVGPGDVGWPGVDLDRVLAIWPDPAVYRRYLRRFADSYAEVSATIATAEPDAVRQLVHKLKGTAGTLGLVEVAARADELEQSLKPQAAKEPKEIERLAGALADALETVLTFIGGFAPETSAPDSAADPEGLPIVLSEQTHARVAVMLSQALAAFEQFEPVAAATILKELSVHLPPPQLAQACRAAENLDSSAGAAALTALAAVLGIELQKQC